MIQKVKHVLKKRKAKLFFLFLLCSGLAWFVSNLSDRYVSRGSFSLAYVNPPDSMLLVDASKKQMELKLEAVGFQFLAFNLGNRNLRIDLSNIKKDGDVYFIPPTDYSRQLEKQLPGSVRLLETEGDSLFFELYHVITKRVPVVSQVELQFPQNYLLDGTLQLVPDSISLKGPQNEIDTIEFVKTERLELVDLTSDFSVVVKLHRNNILEHTSYSDPAITVKGTVSRFSEKVISVPVSVKNIPQEVTVELFPSEVKVLVKASLNRLKTIKSGDFEVMADYDRLERTNANSMVLQLSKKPKTIHSARLLKGEVDFILKRE